MVTSRFLNFLFNSFLVWAPLVFFWLIFFLALVIYFYRHQAWFENSKFNFVSFKNLIMTAIGFRILYAILATVGQYYIWSQSVFTEPFINSPLTQKVGLPLFLDLWPGIFKSHLGYFLFYSYGRFWLNPIIAIVIALGFYLFLKALKRYRERFFDKGELALGFLLAFIAGWPAVLVFLFLAFVFMVFIAIFRQIFLQQAYTTLGWSMLMAAFLVLGWGNPLINLLNLTVLKI